VLILERLQSRCDNDSVTPSEYYDTEVTAGRIYPQLDAMIEKGLIRKEDKNGLANEYYLTKRGVRDLQAHREWENQYLAPIDELST